MSSSPLQGVPFVKASACGNDFLIVHDAGIDADLAEVTRILCDRFNGIGADGVEWVSDSTEANIRAHLINSDGSYAEISGNGTRCVAAWYVAEHGASQVTVETGAGVKTCTLADRERSRFRFRTSMGKPLVGQPFNLHLKSGEIRGVNISMGNPHFVTFVNSFPVNWQVIASEIQAECGTFPEGTNVELVRVIDHSRIEIRIFERGAGETMSSGTGSSAAAAAAITIGRVQNSVEVISPGGPQIVSWSGEDLVLEGPAHIICRGEFLL